MSAIDVLWCDEHVVAVYKPAGMPAQADPSGDLDLLGAVRAQLNEPSIGSVHRLDRPVSGVMLFGRTPTAIEALNLQFRERSLKKVYWTIVEGQAHEGRTVQNELTHDTKAHKARVGVSTNRQGQQAILHIHPLVVGDRYTLLKVEPEGGAFHQIRAQLGAIGHPVKGDVKYGAKRGERDRSIALHARSITFINPGTQLQKCCSAQPPTSPIWRTLMAHLSKHHIEQ